MKMTTLGLKMFNIVCVYKTGGDYGLQDVENLLVCCNKHLSHFSFMVMSDCDEAYSHFDCIPLLYDLPGWWSKMEIFRPTVGIGHSIYMDLDTVIVGDIERLFTQDKFTMLTDFYRSDGRGSGLMYITPEVSKVIWKAWCENPLKWMQKHRVGGDQRVLEEIINNNKIKCASWQEDHPDRIVSYKVHCKDELPESACTVCFHGKPRPNQVKEKHKWIQHAWA